MNVLIKCRKLSYNVVLTDLSNATNKMLEKFCFITLKGIHLQVYEGLSFSELLFLLTLLTWVVVGLGDVVGGLGEGVVGWCLTEGLISCEIVGE